MLGLKKVHRTGNKNRKMEAELHSAIAEANPQPRTPFSPRGDSSAAELGQKHISGAVKSA